MKVSFEFDDLFLEFLWHVAGLLVGPIAALVLIGGNVGVILGMFPPHVAWTVYSLVK